LCEGEGRNTRVLACAALVRKAEEGGIGRMGSMGEGGGQKVGRGWAGEGGVGLYAGRGIGNREGRESPYSTSCKPLKMDWTKIRRKCPIFFLRSGLNLVMDSWTLIACNHRRRACVPTALGFGKCVGRAQWCTGRMYIPKKQSNKNLWVPTAAGSRERARAHLQRQKPNHMNIYAQIRVGCLSADGRRDTRSEPCFSLQFFFTIILVDEMVIYHLSLSLSATDFEGSDVE